jgi:CDP-diacylglycerol pyrophosphatase
MKTTIACLCLLAVAATTQAADPCQKVNGLAETVMSARQNGVSMMRMVEIGSAEGEPNPIFMDMVKEAFSVSAYQTEQFKVKATREFADSQYLKCVTITSR